MYWNLFARLLTEAYSGQTLSCALRDIAHIFFRGKWFVTLVWSFRMLLCCYCLHHEKTPILPNHVRSWTLQLRAAMQECSNVNRLRFQSHFKQVSMISLDVVSFHVPWLSKGYNPTTRHNETIYTSFKSSFVYAGNRDAFFVHSPHHLKLFTFTLHHGQPHPFTGSTLICGAQPFVDQEEQTKRGVVLDLRTNLTSCTCPGIPRAKTLWTKNAPIMGLWCMYRIFCQECDVLYDDCSYPR